MHAGNGMKEKSNKEIMIMASKKAKTPVEMLSEVFNRTVEIMSDLTTATAAASVNASLTSARSMIKFQKGATKAGLNVVGKVQEYTEKSLRDAVKDGEWLPEEGREAVDEWAKMMDSGIEQFSRVVDKSFDLMLKYLDRVEKEGKAKSKTSEKKSTTQKASVKKAPAKRLLRRKRPPRPSLQPRRKARQPSNRSNIIGCDHVCMYAPGSRRPHQISRSDEWEEAF
jgi:hypothetical protein